MRKRKDGTVLSERLLQMVVKLNLRETEHLKQFVDAQVKHKQDQAINEFITGELKLQQWTGQVITLERFIKVDHRQVLGLDTVQRWISKNAEALLAYMGTDKEQA